MRQLLRLLTTLHFLASMHSAPLRSQTAFMSTLAARSVLVSGATGKQGGAVVDALLEKKKFKVFGISRDPSSPASKALQSRGVEVLKADFNDKSSVVSAIQTSGASLFYLVTDFQGAKFNKATEILHGTNCVDAAKECGTIDFFVFSSVGGCEEAPEAVEAFKSKLEIENVLKQSGLNFGILRPHAFFENFNMFPMQQGVASGMLAPEAKSHFIACRDIGKAAAVMMESPAQWRSKTLDCTSCYLSGDEVGQALSRASGEACVYKTSGFAKFIKWFGYFGFLNGIRSMLVSVEQGVFAHADPAKFLQVVPDAMDAEAYFASLGKWGNGQSFRRFSAAPPSSSG